MSAEHENYAIIKDGKVYQNAFLNYSEREIGLIDDENPIENYVSNFNDFKKEVDELITKIDEQENKGSFLSYLENLRNKISEVKGVGDFESIFKTINQYEVDINNQIRQNRERNLSVKKGFIEELKELVKTQDASLVLERVKDIRGKWIRVGAVDKALQEELQSEFNGLINPFFERYKEVISEELSYYNELIEELKELALEEDLLSSKKRIIEIQKEWKLLPKIPKDEYVPLFNEYKKLNDDYFEKLNSKVNADRDAKRAVEHEKGLKERTQLIEDAKNLLAEIDNHQIKDLKELQGKWKTAARVNREKSDELWAEFSVTCDEFFERKNLDFQSQKRKISDEQAALKFKIKLLKDSIADEKRKQPASRR